MPKKTPPAKDNRGTKGASGRAKADNAVIEEATPNAIADHATFGTSAVTGNKSRPRKTASLPSMTGLADGQAERLLMADEFIGPPTVVLKEKFSAQKIPLQTDFAELIDVADCGRKAAGLNPAQTGGTGEGLQLDAEERLAVRPEQLLVPGMIMMFSGSIAPPGWAFCDGADGRPDLRNRFILGGDVSENNSEGGSSISGNPTNKSYSVNTSSVSAGAISLTIDDTVLSVAQMPKHNHLGGIRYLDSAGSEATKIDQYGAVPLGAGMNCMSYYTDRLSSALAFTSEAGESLPHGHSGSATQAEHAHTITTLPAYYILAFIIKL